MDIPVEAGKGVYLVGEAALSWVHLQWVKFFLEMLAFGGFFVAVFIFFYLAYQSVKKDRERRIDRG